MKTKRVLIVDDEAAIVTVLKNSLKNLGDGFEINTATDGQSALDKLNQEPYDLVITDYKMAGMDGLQLLNAVRSLQPDAITILMTAYGNDRVEVESRRLNAYRYLIKPIEIDNFRQIVKAALSDMTSEDLLEGSPTQMKIKGQMQRVESEATREMESLKRVTIYPEQQKAVEKALRNLMARCPAQYALLTDVNGQMISAQGKNDEINPVILSSLIAGDFAASQEIARVTGQYQHFQFVLREGFIANTFISEVGEDLILFTQVNKAIPLGWARLVICEAGQKLSEIMTTALGEIKDIKLDLNEDSLAEWVDDALNSLWK